MFPQRNVLNNRILKLAKLGVLLMTFTVSAPSFAQTRCPDKQNTFYDKVTQECSERFGKYPNAEMACEEGVARTHSGATYSDCEMSSVQNESLNYCDAQAGNGNDLETRIYREACKRGVMRYVHIMTEEKPEGETKL